MCAGPSAKPQRSRNPACSRSARTGKHLQPLEWDRRMDSNADPSAALRDDNVGISGNRVGRYSLYNFNEATSTVVAGYFSFMPSSASARMPEIATLRYHLWSAGITNQGACLWLVSAKISS